MAETVFKREEVELREEEGSNDDQTDSGPDQPIGKTEEANGTQKKKRQNSARWKRWWLKNRDKYNERRRISAQARSAKARARKREEATNNSTVTRPTLPAVKKLKATVSSDVITPPVMSWNGEGLQPTISPAHSLSVPPRSSSTSSYLPFLPAAQPHNAPIRSVPAQIPPFPMMGLHPQMASGQIASGPMVMPSMILTSQPPSPILSYPTHLMAPLPLSVFQPIGLMPPSVKESVLQGRMNSAQRWTGRPFVGSGTW